jgi:hypothetical protein
VKIAEVISKDGRPKKQITKKRVIKKTVGGKQKSQYVPEKMYRTEKLKEKVKVSEGISTNEKPKAKHE